MRRLIANDTIRRSSHHCHRICVDRIRGLSVAIIGMVTTHGSALKTNFYDKVLRSFRSLSA